MVRSSPAVAALLVLALGSARLVATACEIACRHGAGRSQAASTLSLSSSSTYECHAAVAGERDAPSQVSSSGHRDACAQHATLEPFVLASKSFNATGTADLLAFAEARLATDRVASPPRTPLGPVRSGADAARAVPLRI